MAAATLLTLFQTQQSPLAQIASAGAQTASTVGNSSQGNRTASDVMVGERELTAPTEWQAGRVTDGSGRSEAEKILADLIIQMGARRASIYDYGDRFAVRVVAPTDTDVERVASANASSPVPFQLVSVASSDAWLQDTATHLSKTLADVGVLAGVDLEAGRVYAGTANVEGESSEARRMITAEVDQALAQGRAAGEVTDTTKATDVLDLVGVSANLVDARDNGPLKSGRWVYTETFACTAGYMVIGNDSGVKRFTTAGHCFTNSSDTQVQMPSGATVGSRTQWWPSGWDTANFSVPSAWQQQAAITVRSNGNYRKVIGAGNPVNGSQYCFTGRGSVARGDDEKCNTQSRTVLSGGKTLYCIERRTYGGDSGGPVYYIDSDGPDAYARGTMVLDLTIDHKIAPTDHFACYNRIDDIAAAGNWSVVLWK